MRRRALKLTSHAILTCVLSFLIASAAVPAMGDALHYRFNNPNPGFFGLWNGLTESNSSGVRKLTLTRTELWHYDLGSGAEPRAAYRTNGGDTVVADYAGGRVLVITHGGSVGWSYDSGDNSKLVAPAGVAPGAEAGSVLIADPSGRQVLDVSVDKSVRWHYRASDHPELDRPTSARMVPGTDHVLITDAAAGRVIEVTQGGSTTWSSSAADEPRDAKRVSADRTLITDQARHRVIMVDGSGAVRWHFGADGVAGSDMHHLDSPTSADRLGDGSVLIADTGNNRVLRVSSGGTVTDVYGNGGASDSNGSITPVGGVSGTNGGTLIVDTAGHRLIEVGYVSAGTFDTPALDLGMQGVDKWMTDILPVTTDPKGTSVRVSYSQDGGAWLAAGHGGSFTIADGASAKTVRFHVVFTTSDPHVSPSMSRLDAKFYLQKPSKWDPNKGKGSGSGTGSGSKNSTSTAGAGSGSGSGSGGSGTGSGSGGGGTGGSGGGGGAKSSTPAAGGKTSIGGGTADGTGNGTGGAGVKSSNTISGMVMSEVTEDAGGASTAAGPGSYGNGAPVGNELIPSAALMLVAYSLGLAWKSTTRWVSRLVPFRIPG